jgi:hypothetical protein
MPRKPSDEEGLFIRVNNPTLIRKNILESSKLVLTILKQTYKVKQIREIKQEKISDLSQQIKELRILIQKIEELMPQYTKADLKKLLPDIPLARKSSEPTKADKPEAKAEANENWAQEPKQAAPVSEMDRITKALEDVQKKLQTL